MLVMIFSILFVFSLITLTISIILNETGIFDKLITPAVLCLIVSVFALYILGH